jgi:ParB-like chromosome segregation protein Spo0J
MTELRIDALLANPQVDPDAHLNQERVAHYAAQPPEAIEPIVVFRTPEGLLVADGYHRLAAARQRGATTINADIRPGSQRDALKYAATAGAAQRHITTEQAKDHIRRRSTREWGS